MNSETTEPGGTESPDTGKPRLETRVSLLMAAAVVLGTVGLVVAVGLYIGYRTVWNQFDRTDRLTAETARWSEAAATNPGDFEAQYQLGWSQFQRGNLAEALEAFQAAVDLKPEHVGALYNLGLTYFELKQYDQAVAPFKAVAERFSRHELAWLSLGRSYLEMGQLDQALSALLHAAGINPSSADTRFYLGTAHERLGNIEVAIQEYRESLRYDPLYKEATEALRRLGVTDL